MANWLELSTELERLLRLRTSPLGLKRLARIEDLGKIPGVRNVAPRSTICQLLTIARTAGLTVAATRENVLPCPFANSAGLLPAPEGALDNRVGGWLSSLEDAQKQRDAFPELAGECQAIVMAPLALQRFEPEVILVYANPAQIVLLGCGLQRQEYECFEFSFVGESSCLDATHRCYATGKPALSLPCYGERWLGGAADDEISMALPPEELGKGIEGLRALHAIGWRYPIPSLGSEADPLIGLRRIYGREGVVKTKAVGRSFWD